MTADIHGVGLTGARFGRAHRRPKADRKQPEAAPEPVAPEPLTDEAPLESLQGPEVPPQRDTGETPVPPPPVPPPPVPPLPRPQRYVPPLPQPQRPPVPPQRGPLSASPLDAVPLGAFTLKVSPLSTSPELSIDPNDPPHDPAPSHGFGSHDADDNDDPKIDYDAISAPTVRVRPYIHTGGRTRASTPLPLESMVRTAPGASALRLNGAHRWVAELCSVPQSVAEVSARLGVPLAVARVVVDDLVEQRMVTVQRGVGSGAPDPTLLKRVLAGLRRL